LRRHGKELRARLPFALAIVNLPIGVAVNGKPAEVLSAVGFPGAVDGYQVNFSSAPDAAKGPCKYSGKRCLDIKSARIPVQ
jgi:hypothetical protein